MIDEKLYLMKLTMAIRIKEGETIMMIDLHDNYDAMMTMMIKGETT